MKRTSPPRFFILAILVGAGASLVFAPALIRQIQGPQSTMAASPAEMDDHVAAESSAGSDDPWMAAILPQGMALMIPGSSGTPGDYAHSNSAVAAGLPPVGQFEYQTEVAKLVSAASGRGADGNRTRTAGTGNRFTQAEIDALNSGVNTVFTDLENALVAEIFGEKLPLIGDGFQIAWENNTDSFRLLTQIRTAIVTGLSTFTGSPDYDPAAVATAIRNQLGSFDASTSVVCGTLGDQARIDFVTRRIYGSANVPIAQDFGFPQLDFKLLGTANVSTTASAQLNFAIGVDAEGFYLETAGSTFTFNTSTNGSGINTTARLAKLDHVVTNNAALMTTQTANFNILLKEPGGDGKLRVAELTTPPAQPDLLDATLTGNTRTALKLVSEMPNTVLFPRVGTDLTILWDFNNAAVDPDDDNSTFGSQPVLTLNNNRVLLDSFLNHFASGVLGKIRDVTEPVQPVIDVLSAPIPLLSDLGSSKVSLMDIFSVPQETQDAVNSLSRISNLANLAQGLAAGGLSMDMGDWSFAQHDPRVDGPDELTGSSTRPPSPNKPAPLASFLSEADKIDGLDFPVLTDGKPVVDMLLGRNASLFNYRSGKIEVMADFDQYFPVLGPIGVTLGVDVGFGAEFGFGYDTQGMFDYFAGGSNDASLLANGFYAMALDEQGDPLTGAYISGAFTAGVELNILIASAGVEGRLGASIGIYLNDQIGDELGRIRADDFASHSVDEWFDASGRLFAGLRAYLEIGWPPFGIEFEFESPEVTLLSFDSRPVNTPVLAMLSPPNFNQLELNVGDRAPLRIHGDNLDTAENYLISTQGGLNGPELLIEAFGAENTISPLPTKIIGHAAKRGDSLEMDPDVDIDVHFSGGSGPDLLRGGAGDDLLEGGEAPDILHAHGGNNIMRGGEDNDTLVGGGGNDEFDGGPGNDTAAWTDAPFPMAIDLRTMTFTGAAMDATLISIERYRGSPFPDIMDGSEGDDQTIDGHGGDDFVRGHGGNDLLMGGSGNDEVEGGSGNDHIMGGPGPDSLDGGTGTDTLSFLLAGSPVTASLLTGVGTRGEALGDTYANFEILVGSGLPKTSGIPVFGNPAEESGDILHGDHDPDTIYGMDGADEIHGHGGDDILYGNHPDTPESEIQLPGFDADKIFGGDGNDTIHGHGDADLLNGESGSDTLYGGNGNDHLTDTDTASPDHLDGEIGYDRISADYSSSTAGLSFIVGQQNGRLFPNGDQYHNMETLGAFLTGSGNDIIRLSATLEPLHFNKTIDTGAGDDLVFADTRESYPVLGRTSDALHGGPGTDTVSFEQSAGGVDINLSTNASGGHAAEMTISGFENLTGSDFDDTLTGTAVTASILGGGGDDSIISLTPGHTDLLDGGVGYDRISADYSDQTQSINFTVGQENSHTFPGGGQYLGMETLGSFKTGSANDIIRLAAVPEPKRFNKTIDAGPGNDLVVTDSRHVYGLSGRSNDVLHGGDGIDTLSFEQSIEAVQVDMGGLLAGLGYPPLGRAAAGLTISGFENLVGTNHVDILAGDHNNNIFTPLRGVSPPELNFDEIHGGGGTDTLVVDYSGDSEAAVTGMRMASSSGSFAAIALNLPMEYPPKRHYYTSIEQFHVTGSQGPDVLYGELIAAGHDRFLGLGGHDWIEGRGGDDFIDGGDGFDFLTGDHGNDTIYGGTGNDTIRLDGRASEAAGYGNDLADGGDGDDFISIHENPGTGGNYARTGNRMQVDGGPGFDSLTIDLAYLTTSFNWDDAAPTDQVLRNGGYIRNIERIRDICTGSGVDTILLRGRHDNKVSTGDGNDVLNAGLGKDIIRMGYYLDDNLLIVDYSEGDTPDLGGAIQVYSGPIERRRLADNVIIDSITFAGGPSRMHFTGTSKRDVIWGFNEGGDILLGGGGNDQLDGNGGNDWIDGGPGADTMTDSHGNDTYVVDDAGDQVIAQGGEYWWVNGTDTVRSSVDYTLPFALENLQLTGTAISGTGNIIANNITGNTRNNILNGGGDNDSLNGGGGAREIDTLIGGGGADTFFLGLLGNRFYDDGNPATPGHDGYALISDFTLSQNDRLRFAGAAGQYLLGVSPFHPDDDALYHDSNGNATLDPATDELIAILQSTETLTAANTITNASYQNAVDPALVGLTAAPVPSLTTEGGAKRLAASFSILETLPANVSIEVQASNDLGIYEPWSMIARKSGNGAWTGPAQVVTEPPSAGRVSVTVRDIPLFPQPPRRFLRIVLVPQ